MKNLKDIIIEKLVINKNVKSRYKYSCQPKDKDELKEILKERLERDANDNLNDIDVSKITNMSNLFYKLDPHNINISEWDVSNVKDMYSMFLSCKNFNCDLSKWDVSNVTNMDYMFCGCRNFNCDLSKWNVDYFCQFIGIFKNCNLSENPPKWYYKGRK